MNVRNAMPGELCVCGRQAVEVFVYESGREVGYCGIPDGGQRTGPCPLCGSIRRHATPWGEPAPCPHYQVRPGSASAGEWMGRCSECGTELHLDGGGWPVSVDGLWFCPVNADGHLPDDGRTSRLAAEQPPLFGSGEWRSL